MAGRYRTTGARGVGMPPARRVRAALAVFPAPEKRRGRPLAPRERTHTVNTISSYTP